MIWRFIVAPIPTPTQQKRDRLPSKPGGTLVQNINIRLSRRAAAVVLIWDRRLLKCQSKTLNPHSKKNFLTNPRGGIHNMMIGLRSTATLFIPRNADTKVRNPRSPEEIPVAHGTKLWAFIINFREAVSYEEIQGLHSQAPTFILLD